MRYDKDVSLFARKVSPTVDGKIAVEWTDQKAGRAVAPQIKISNEGVKLEAVLY